MKDSSSQDTSILHAVQDLVTHHHISTLRAQRSYAVILRYYEQMSGNTMRAKVEGEKDKKIDWRCW
jgi:hypothetical protein